MAEEAFQTLKMTSKMAEDNARMGLRELNMTSQMTPTAQDDLQEVQRHLHCELWKIHNGGVFGLQDGTTLQLVDCGNTQDRTTLQLLDCG